MARIKFFVIFSCYLNNKKGTNHSKNEKRGKEKTASTKALCSKKFHMEYKTKKIQI